ncbi:MAG: hypothetical protein QNK37_24845 [Acidobacteriota bacterium]|nr:hypothetical protein [Acidobacteriota bacterium]
MAIAILDGKYEIQRQLEVESSSPVYLAADPRGQRRLIKFVRNPDRFFEEMARLYACDGISGVCRLCYNYPPHVVSGQTVLLENDICRMFKEEPLRDTADEETVSQSAMARTGALVLEFVPGIPLSEVLCELDDYERLERLAPLAGTLAQIHARGEAHGALCDDHVLLDVMTGQTTVVGLGPGESRGIRRRESPTAVDVRDFARNYLAGIAEPSKRLKRLIAGCTHEKVKRRPSMKTVYRSLVKELALAVRPWYQHPAVPLALTAVLICALTLGMRLRPSEEQLVLSNFADKPVLAATSLPIEVHQTKLKPFCDLLTGLLGVQFSMTGKMAETTLPPTLISDDNWKALFDELGLKWEDAVIDGNPVIKITHVPENKIPDV